MVDIVAEFDAAIENIAIHDHPCPTADSITKIERHFEIRLPSLLIVLAQNSKKFSSRFLSLGPDFESPSHIIRVNSYWRRRRRTKRVPRDLVIFTEGWMDNRFWCVDRTAPSLDSDYAIEFWCPEEIIYASEADRPVERYSDFESFLRADIYWTNFHNKNDA